MMMNLNIYDEDHTITGQARAEEKGGTLFLKENFSQRKAPRVSQSVTQISPGRIDPSMIMGQPRSANEMDVRRGAN